MIIFVSFPGLGQVGSQRPGTRREETQIVRLDGNSFINFNFNRLPPEYLQQTPEEDFSFYFLTDKPNGLIWYHDEPGRKMFLTMKVDRFLDKGKDILGFTNPILVQIPDSMIKRRKLAKNHKNLLNGSKVASIYKNSHAGGLFY